MKRFFSLLFAILFLLGALASCGAETPADVPSTQPVSDAGESSGTEPATEPVSEPDADPFEGADQLPEDLVVPSCLKTADGTVLGTIVLPEAGKEDAVLAFAAQDLQYHLKKVLGADFPIVSRPGEGYGSIILATPDTLPAVTDMFADDLAWLADLGSKETGRWGKDGFAVRRAGDDIWIIGNISKGAMNGVYDLIEDNLGVLWFRADESEGLVYDELEEATIAKVDYREKSPFLIRGCLYGSEYSNGLLLARNKCNTRIASPELGGETWSAGHSILSLLLNSPSYDPEETEYWETDDQGNSLGREGTHQVNPWSDKAADVIADSIIARMKNSGTRFVFIGEEDASEPQRCYPYDEQPFEYAPGQFVQPEDKNYYSTVFHTMINKIARKVKEEIPDGWVGTFAYAIARIPPACDMEDNIQICYAPYGENYSRPILDPELLENGKDEDARGPVEYIPAWAEKVNSIVFWPYYTCNAQGTEYSWPIWYRIQGDLQAYHKLGVVDGMATDGLPDLDQSSSWITYNGAKGTCSNYWDMNHLLIWLYQKLLWNPYEDIPSLIEYFCDKVYKDASPYMKEYYRLMEQGWNVFADTFYVDCSLRLKTAFFYKSVVKKTGIGHGVLDALEAAYGAAPEQLKEMIKYMWDSVRVQMEAFRSF